MIVLKDFVNNGEIPPEVSELDTILEEFRSYDDVTLNDYALPNRRGFRYPSEKESAIRRFLRIAPDIVPSLGGDAFFDKAKESEDECDFWAAIENYVHTRGKGRKKVAAALDLPTDELRTQLFQYTLDNHLRYRDPIQSDTRDFSQQQLAAALHFLEFAHDFIFVKLRGEESFIEESELVYSVPKDLSKFIWLLFRDRREEMRYQALILKLNSLEENSFEKADDEDDS